MNNTERILNSQDAHKMDFNLSNLELNTRRQDFCIKSELDDINVEYFFDWMLTNDCNFYCDYCHPNVAVHKNESSDNIKTSQEIAGAFLNLNKRFHLSMSGGEPFLFSNFTEFCKTITDLGNSISINTNLSIREGVKKFSDNVDPYKVVSINAALHKQERERQRMNIEDFAEDIIMLQKKEFPVQVFYVLYPPLLDSFENDAIYLKELGVNKVAGKIFKGSYEGKIYPRGYSEEDRKKILLYKNNDYPITMDYLNDVQYMFKNRRCTAGVNFFKINIDGSVQRCPSNRRMYGNIYENTFKPMTEASPCVTTSVMSVSQCNQFAEPLIRTLNK